MSPYGTKSQPGSSGLNGSRIAGLCVTASEAMVLPWKPCSNATNRSRPVASRASLIAPSFASAPEFEKKALCIPVRSTIRFASSAWPGT